MSCPNEGMPCNCTGACFRPANRISVLRANAAKDVVVEKNRLLIGGEEFLFPIVRGSVSAKKATKKYNALTLTLLVGEVTFVTEDSTEEPPDENAEVLVSVGGGAMEWVSDPALIQRYRDLRDAEHDLFEHLVDDTF